MTEIEEIQAEINRLSEILVRLTMEKALEETEIKENVANTTVEL